MAKTERSKLNKENEDMAKKIAKLRDKNICQKCGKLVSGTNCHGSHVIPVSRDGRLRCDSINIKVLCYHCHKHWWHKHPVEAGHWYTEKFPKRWEYLEEEHKQNQKKGTISILWIRERNEQLKQELQNLKNEVIINDVTIEDLPF